MNILFKKIFNFLMFFLFLFLFPSFIVAHECGIYPPHNSSYCFNYNTDEKRNCCYVYNEEESFCLLLEPEKTKTEIEINSNKYKVECNTLKNISLLGYPCGLPNPKDISDCSDQSLSSPCCLYNNSYTGVTGCFYLGELTSTTLITYDKELIFCLGDYIKPLFGKFWIFGLSLLSFITL